MMKIRAACLFLGVCSLLILEPGAKAATQASFYVSTSGNDNNPGTQNAPYKTITRARNEARKITGNMRGDVIVYLRGGTYFLAAPLQLNHKDSGTNGHDIIYRAYPGETPIISGGVPVKGWTLDHDQIYKAPLDRNTKLRTLFVKESLI